MRILFLFLCLSLSITNIRGEEKPQLWGYGAEGCASYMEIWYRWEEGEERGIAEYLRYRAWLAGFVSGLSLATGMDVLHQVDIGGAMRRVRLICEETPGDDFFNASIRLIKTLSSLR